MNTSSSRINQSKATYLVMHPASDSQVPRFNYVLLQAHTLNSKKYAI